MKRLIYILPLMLLPVLTMAQDKLRTLHTWFAHPLNLNMD